jgi:phage anti-repressor protein
MQQLIKISTTESGSQVVSARELHKFLESKQQFADWIKDRIDKYGFIENQDFEVFQNFMKNPNGGRPLKEYALTLDMAKELAMVEGNDKGRQARRYFIECEKKLREVVTKPMTTLELIAAQAQAMVEMEKRMNAMDDKINFIYDQYQDSQKQLSLLPLSDEPMPEQSLRSKINELVRSYATMVGADYKDVWVRVYKDLYYRYGVNVNAVKSIKNRETKLEKLERTGNLSQAYSVISEMIRVYKSNTIA